MKLRYTMSYKAWSEFFVEVCAITGGMFVVAGIVESLLRNTVGAIGISSDSKRNS